MNGTVLFCGAWDEGPGYPRTAALRASLQSQGLTVAECRLPGAGAGKREVVRRPWRWPGALWALLRQRWALVRRLRVLCRGPRPAAVVVPYPGHGVIRAVAAHSPSPVVLDLFLSAYDTAVLDRGWFPPGSLPARWLRRLDRNACAAADLVLVDTAENAAFLAELTGLPPERFAAVPVADPDAPLVPAPLPPPAAAGRLQVLFFGTGVPLHGLRTLLTAVVQAPAVDLTLVGGTADDRAFAARALGPRLHLGDPFESRALLQRRIDAAELVAGVFGTSAKAGRVVPFKVAHALAAGRPVLTAGTPAVARLLDERDGVFTVPAGDPAALAAMLQELAAAPARLRAAAAGARAAYDRHFAVERTGERLLALLAGLQRRSST